MATPCNKAAWNELERALVWFTNLPAEDQLRLAKTVFHPVTFPDRENGRLADQGLTGDRDVNNHPNRSKNERAVLVTTAHRGVFFGYAKETDGSTISLRAARCCVYWPPGTKGFLGLASSGPGKDAKIGPAADIELRDITCVAECTEAAVSAWEAAPWAR